MKEKKILFVGSGPLICEGGIVNQTAFGLRTWQFLSVIKNNNAAVRLILLDEARFYTKFPVTERIRVIEIFGKKIEVVHLEKNTKNFVAHLENFSKAFNPTVAVGINLMPSFYLSKLDLNIPFWADLNGWALAEAQSQAFIEKKNAYIPQIWQLEKQVLRTADKISTVSNPQNLATMGQLSTLGRLRFENEKHSFVTTIENANETQGLEKFLPTRKKYNLRSKFDSDALLVFFSGAYNTWLDEKNLFLGLEKAMKKNKNLYFVSTGSGIKGFSNKVFHSFKSRIEKSEFSDRFVFLGWLDRADLIDCYSQVDVAINLDRDNTETQFGARNRINEWLIYGVPIMSTIGSQITQDLAEADLIIPIKLENADDICKKILNFSKSSAQFMATAAQKFSKEHYSYTHTMEPLVEFLKNPIMAPDKNKKLSMQSSFIRRGLFKVQQIGLCGVFDLIKNDFFRYLLKHYRAQFYKEGSFCIIKKYLFKKHEKFIIRAHDFLFWWHSGKCFF